MLDNLRDLGYVKESQEAFTFTMFGGRKLSHCSPMRKSSQVFEPLALGDLKSATKYQLLLALKDRDWIAKRPWPGKKGSPPPFVIQDQDCPKVMYVGGPKTPYHYFSHLHLRIL